MSVPTESGVFFESFKEDILPIPFWTRFTEIDSFVGTIFLVVISY